MDKFLQDALNGGDLTFRVTADRQIHNKNMEIDKERYIVGILRQITSPYSVSDIDAVVSAYEIEFYGYSDDYDEFVAALELLPKVDSKGNSYYYQEPTFDEFKDKGGSGKFKARIGFQTIFIKGTISGQEVTFTINGQQVPIKSFIFRKDKTLISNIMFGKNNEVRLITETLTLGLPITANAKIQEMLLDVLDDSYNKTYELKWVIGSVEKVTTYVSRGGFMDGEVTPQPLGFSIILERALPRKTLEIAMFESEPFWFITDSGEVYNESYENEITTEQEFSDFLDSLEIDTVGYVVRNVYHTDFEWQFVGVFDYVTSYNRLVEKLSDEIYSEVSFMNYVAQQAVEADGFELVVETGTNKFAFLKEGQDASITPTKTLNRNWSGANYLDILTELYNESDFAVDYEVGDIILVIIDSAYYWYIEVERAITEWVYLGKNIGIVADYNQDAGAEFPDTAEHAINYMNINFDIVNFEDREIFELEQDFGGNKYYFYANIKKFYKAKIESDAVVFYGEYKDGGQYGGYKTLPSIEYGYTIDNQVETTTSGENVKAVLTTFSRGLRVVFVSGDKDLADDIIKAERRLYKIKFFVSGNEYELENMKIQTAGIPVNENADLIIDATFVESE